jgi:hypothetical protein
MTYEQAREQLREMAGVYDYRARMRAGTDRSSYTPSGVARRPAQVGRNQFNLRSGQEPTNDQIHKFMSIHGYGPTGARLNASSVPSAGAPAPAPQAGGGRGNPLQNAGTGPLAGGASGMASAQSPYWLLRQLAAQQQLMTDQANAANDARYAEGHGELTDLRDRNQDRAVNWGVAQAQLNEERAAESLKRQRAILQARGLSNSNDLPAWQARNDRDLALVQQDLSEKRDDRLSRYDSADTGSLVRLIESRHDNAPDTRQYDQLVARLGEAQAFQQAQEQLAQTQAAPQYGVEPQQKPQQRRVQGALSIGAASRINQGMMNQLQGVAPRWDKKKKAWVGGRAGTGPLAAAQMAYGSMNPIPYGIMYGTPANTTNAFPHRIGESKQHAYARRTGMIAPNDGEAQRIARWQQAEQAREEARWKAKGGF